MFASDSTDYGKQLLCEIDRLAEERRSYASKFNDTLPIFRLAPETLCTIFILYKQDALDTRLKLSMPLLISLNSSVPKGWGRPWCYVPWVAISYVCRRFRSLTLEFPSFWTTLCVHSVPWTQELIRRSKQAPLHVLYLSALPPLPPTVAKDREIALICLRLALAHNVRIETLEFLNFDLASLTGREEVFAEVLNPKSFRNLRNIKIILPGSHNRWMFSQPMHSLPRTVPIPEGSDALSRLVKSLAQNPLSPLRDLQLAGYGRNIWYQASSSTSLASLSRLAIEACPDATVNIVLSALKNLPQLQHLIIRDCDQIDSFQLDNVALNSNLVGITLSSLRSFTLSGVLGVGGRLLESLILPSDVKLKLEVGISPYGAGMVAVGEPPLLERFERLLQVLDSNLQGDSDSYVVDNFDLYVQDDTDHAPPPLTEYQAKSKFRRTSMLFTNGSGAICFALSDGDDYDPPVRLSGSPPGYVPPIPSYKSPAPNPSFQFTADLSRHPEAAQQISEALLSKIKSGSLLENVEHVILREFQPGMSDACSWPTARWLQTVVRLPQLKTLDVDLNFTCMAVLFGLLDVRHERESNTLTYSSPLGFFPPSAVQLQSLYLHRADPRILTGIPAPPVVHMPPPIAGVNNGISPTHSPFGGHLPLLAGPVSVLPYPPSLRSTQPTNNNTPVTVSPGQTIGYDGGNPSTTSRHFTHSSRAAHSQSWAHFNLTRPVSPPKTLQRVKLFGQHVPFVESLYPFLIQQRTIADVFQGRKDAGLALKKLTIQNSQMSEETFEELKEVVPEVDWDSGMNCNWKRDLWDNALGNIDSNLNASD
ncbi:hypothetical protein DL96DRAFT_207872 [Flagelloscypha sp. PMI_526]|nr:hypothetical protein DL96DRAFT_207872 [Flagelloscypha sp. PMI_526]